MAIIKTIGDFLLSAWLWHITFDWFHPIVTGAVMFCLLRFVMHRRRLESLVMSSAIQLCTFGLFTAKVVFGFIRFLGWQYEPLQAEQAMNMMGTLMPSLWVGLIYALLQSLLFIIARSLWRFNLKKYLVLMWLSNACGALISYMLINFIEVYYYIG